MGFVTPFIALLFSVSPYAYQLSVVHLLFPSQVISHNPRPDPARHCHEEKVFAGAKQEGTEEKKNERQTRAALRINSKNPGEQKII
jgi:hypothetical protein